jgi:hypothetical protein
VHGLYPTDGLHNVLPKLPPLDQLELSLAYLFTSNDIKSHERRHVNARRLHVIETRLLPVNRSNLELENACVDMWELKLVILKKESTELFSGILKRWGPDLVQLHLQVALGRGEVLREPPHLLV